MTRPRRNPPPSGGGGRQDALKARNTTKEGVLVEPGQIWRDRDKRTFGRLVKILAVEHGSPPDSTSCADLHSDRPHPENGPDMNDSPDHVITTGIIVMVLAVALFAVICICHRLYLNRPVTGVVIDKEFIPEHLTNSVQNILIDNTLHSQVMVENVPDTWQISVQPEGGGSVVRYDLTRKRWDQITVGDRWPDKNPPR